MSACTQPGCAGTVEDGFCTVCGMAAAPANAAPAAAEAPAARGASTGLCAQPGCGGKIEDGFCVVCGMAGEPGNAATPSISTPSQSLGYTPSGSVRTGSSSRSSRRGMLGLGLVEVPPVPYRDPSEAILAKAEVAEHKRFCSACGEEVGRSHGDRPGRTEGFCPKCGAAFSFTPKLAASVLVGGQYEVLGCLAHGGLGWIYLGRDRNVSDRWIVLKGLLDSGDADAMEAAVAERAFLAQVEHPNCVKIYNFVQHEGSGYIVMEYVGGQSLKQILEQRRREQGAAASLPLGQVIAYGLEVLRAFGYLHGQSLIYCDLKPDNIIQSEEQIKLIDLGAVRHITDNDSAIFGTVGYQAPEIASVGPSVSSDLFTVGRTLAVLSFPFRGFTGKYATTLPPRGEVEVLAKQESYDRFLRRATHVDPAMRFQDAAEMAEQLTGVLREVLSAEDGQERSAPSPLFGPERFVPGNDIAGEADRKTFEGLDPADAAQALPQPLAPTPELGRLLAAVRFAPESLANTVKVIDEFTESPDDWRVAWCRAGVALASGNVAEAHSIFDSLYGLLPGELAPKLALAALAECAERWDEAAGYYELVWRTDRTYVSAVFGLARVRLAQGDWAGAIAALDAVPATSSYYVDAQVAAVAAAIRTRVPDPNAPRPDLIAAGARLEALEPKLDRRPYGELAAELLEAVLAGSLAQPASSAGGTTLLGSPLSEENVRRKLDGTYRGLARLSHDAEEKHALVNRANAVRPRTWF